jgi:zinc/manganese transport system substrate-binding protein
MLMVWAALVPGSAPAQESLRVVCSTSILEDLAKSVGGDRVKIIPLMPRGADHHFFEPTPEQVREAAGADVFLFNGLGLDPWVEKFLSGAGFKGTPVLASAGVEPITLEEHDHDHAGEGHAHDHGVDPHAWMDVRNAMRYVETIRDSFIAVDRAGADAYRARAELMLAQLRVLDGWIRREVSRIPPERRLLVTDHDAFQYFARAYSFQTHTLRGVTTREEPSAKQAAELIDWLSQNQIRFVFLESGGNPRVLDRIAQQGGARVAGRLFAGSLDDEGTQADTYIGMMRENILLLSRTLGSNDEAAP